MPTEEPTIKTELKRSQVRSLLRSEASSLDYQTRSGNKAVILTHAMELVRLAHLLPDEK
jgi:hypothetical protein